MASININGNNYSGNSVVITNGKVYVDGKIQNDDDAKVIKIEVTGNLQELSSPAGEIKITGDVGNVKTQSGDVEVSGNISGNVQTMSGDVDSGPIGGNVSTMSGDIKSRK